MLNEPKKERRFLQIFQLLPDAVLVTRADNSVVLDVNEALRHSPVTEPDTIVGRSALSLFFFLDPDLWTRVRLEVQTHPEVYDLETRLLRKDGRTTFVRMSMRRVEIEGLACHLATIHETSGRKIPEDETQGSRSSASSGLESLLSPDRALTGRRSGN